MFSGYWLAKIKFLPMKTFELSAITAMLLGGIIHLSNAQGVANLPMIAAGGYSGINVRVDGSMWAL